MHDDQTPNNDPTGSLIDTAKEWIAKALPWILGGLSVFFFLIWFGISFFWPSDDDERERVPLLLPNNKTLAVDYPRRFLADDQSLPVYLTADTTQPISLTVSLPTTLPLVLTSVEPISAARVSDAASGYLIVSWPITDTAAISTSLTSITATATISPGRMPITATNIVSLAPITAAIGVSPNLTTALATGTFQSPDPASKGMIPFVKHSNTVTLYLKNARTERGSPSLFFSGFKKASFSVIEAGVSGVIPVDVETTDRAHWRLFAEKYSFIVILPFLIAAFGFLRKMYMDRQNEQRKKAERSLEKFKGAVSSGQLDKINKAYEDLRPLSKYIPTDDLERANAIEKTARAEAPGKSIAADEFSKWPDSWAGALTTAADLVLLGRPSETGSPDAGQSKGEVPQPGGLPQGETSGLIEPQILRRYVRVFPRDLLSIMGDKQFRALTDRLRLRPTQRHGWPNPADLPEGYDKARPTKTAQDMGLFPANSADLDTERRYLFSSATEWFWREHPLYAEISKSNMSILVHGEPGVGKTALALSLTQYADRDSERVLATYHARSAQLADVQLGLARALLGFVRWRSTWLMTLEREDRDLLAGLFLTVMDSRYLLAQLITPELKQFQEATQNKQKALWEEQALLELRLLRQSVELAASEPPIPINRWFLSLSHCAQQLEFARVRIALDMTTTGWREWRDPLLPEFLRIFQGDYALPLQLILMVPCEDEAAYLPEALHATELSWRQTVQSEEALKSPLGQMLRHRAVQRGISEDMIPAKIPANHELIEAAQFNPRRLARLWRFIQDKNPDATAITSQHVAEAKDNVQ